MPFGGSDIPGFIDDPTEDVWIRFYQMGMYYPFFRAHNSNQYENREPWLQTPKVQEVIKDCLDRRYDLIHYIYTTFFWSTQYGFPLWRTMWAEYPLNATYYEIESQFMLGG
jgi:alpha-glucosidase (family GH31 glycosyl hydrolase)